jgi:AmmeMemoRadiSam system protein B
MSVRPTAAAGQFYPSDKDSIVQMIKLQLENEKDLIRTELASKNIIGGVSPHAGYVFSLSEAVHLFRIFQLSKIDWKQVVILNPNHTGRGAPLSVDSHNLWETPLGQVNINNELATFLSESVTCEPEAQKKEHSAEVLLPLLSYFLKDFSLLPLCMGICTYEAASFIAEKMYQYHIKTGVSPLILASSDFTHFQTPARGRALDDYALEPLLNLDSKEFYRRIREKDISICGYGPIMVLLEYAKKISSLAKVTILKRGNSGEAPYFRGVSQDEVVDYVSLLVYYD